MKIHADLARSYTEYYVYVINYFRSAFIEVKKTAETGESDGFGSKFSGAAFLPSPPISSSAHPFDQHTITITAAETSKLSSS